MGHFGAPDNPLRVSEVETSHGFDEFPTLLLTGTAFDRGEKYGRVFADKIHANIARHLAHPELPAFDTCMRLINDVYMPGLKHHFPAAFAELSGMAKGCSADIEYLMIINARDDLATSLLNFPNGVPESTTAFFSHRATAEHVPFVAHSWSAYKEVHSEDLLVCLEIQYPEKQNRPSVFMVTEAGMISGCCMNSEGFVVTGNRLYSNADGPPATAGPPLPVTCLERYVLECRTFERAIGKCVDLDLLASRHILLANAAGSAHSTEINPMDAHFYHGAAGGQTKVHTNHFQSFSAFMYRRDSGDAYGGWSSQARLNRMQALIAEHQQQQAHGSDGGISGGSDGRVSAQQIMDMFSDHDGSPDSSICEDWDEDKAHLTAAFIMFDPDRRIVSVCKGPPCLGTMAHFTFTHEIHPSNVTSAENMANLIMDARMPDADEDIESGSVFKMDGSELDGLRALSNAMRRGPGWVRRRETPEREREREREVERERERAVDRAVNMLTEMMQHTRASGPEPSLPFLPPPFSQTATKKNNTNTNNTRPTMHVGTTKRINVIACRLSPINEEEDSNSSLTPTPTNLTNPDTSPVPTPWYERTPPAAVGAAAAMWLQAGSDGSGTQARPSSPVSAVPPPGGPPADVDFSVAVQATMDMIASSSSDGSSSLSPVKDGGTGAPGGLVSEEEEGSSMLGGDGNGAGGGGGGGSGAGEGGNASGGNRDEEMVEGEQGRERPQKRPFWDPIKDVIGDPDAIAISKRRRTGTQE